MDEKNEQTMQNAPAWNGYTVPVPAYRMPTGRRELWFGLSLLLLSVGMLNCILAGGFNLGFSLGSAACIGGSAVYLRMQGHRFDRYSGGILSLAAVLALGFARAEDGLVEFASMLFMLIGVNLSFCLATGQNHRAPGVFASLADAPRALFRFGFGSMSASARGLKDAARSSGKTGKNTGAVLLGILVAVPLVAVLVILLTAADAAFEGLLEQLPETDLTEPIWSLLLGSLTAWVLYSRTTALHHREKTEKACKTGIKLNVLTVNTVLLAACGVYLAYLLSQLAYLSGGLSGILPEEYTMAQYARRGFFEMACLCGINLTTICIANALTRRELGAPLFTRLLCLFLGLVTVFLTVAASAKMFLYISGYGLTRLRVLTEVITVFIGIVTVLVCVWLFVPRLQYMKAVVLTALIICAGVLWTDVDTVVAKYNVNAYLSGQMEEIDVGYLGRLGPGTVPYLVKLAESEGTWYPGQAANHLNKRESETAGFRAWNLAGAAADQAIAEFRENRGSE